MSLQQAIFEQAKSILATSLYYEWKNNYANIYTYNTSKGGVPAPTDVTGTVTVNGTDYTVCLPTLTSQTAATRLSDILAVFEQQDNYGLSIAADTFGLPDFSATQKLEPGQQAVVGYGKFAKDPNNHSGYFGFTDCSSFINYVVTQAAKTNSNTPDQLFLSGHYPPLASDYATGNLPTTGWTVTNLAGGYSIAAGDILAWKDLSVAEAKTQGRTLPQYCIGGDSGHVMIVLDDVSCIPHGKPFTVNVIDCSDIPHAEITAGTKNNRPTIGGGIGSGQISMMVDEKGWSVSIAGKSNEMCPVDIVSSVSSML